MLVSTARTLGCLLRRDSAVHLVYRDPRALVIENGGPLFDARRNVSLDQLESRPAAGDVELDLAAWRDAQRFPDPLRDGDLTLACDRNRHRLLLSNTK